MRDFWRRLGSPDAISWVSVVAVWFLSGSGPFLSAGVDYRGRVGEFSAVIVIALLAAMPVLAIGKFTLIRIAGRRWAPWLTLAIFEVTLIVRVLVFDGLLVSWGLTAEPQLLWRLASTQATIMFGLLAAAFVVTAAREFSRSSAQLSAQVQFLEELKANAAGKIAAQRERVLDRIRRELRTALEHQEGATALATSQQFQRAIDDVVRPLSLQLRDSIEESGPAEGRADRISWSGVLSATFAGNPFHPLVYGMWVWVASIGTWSPQFGWFTPLLALALAGAGSLAMQLIRLAWPHLPERMSTLARGGAFFVAMTVVTSASAGVSLAFSDQLRQTAPLLSAFWNCLTAGLVIALSGGAIAAMQSAQRSLLELQDELKREVALLNAAGRQSQLALGRVLHGPVQDAIASALRRVESGIPDDALPALVIDLNTTISAVLAAEQRTDEIRSFAAALSDLRELWEGVCRIDVSVSDADARAIQLDPAATVALIELAREACSNAIRHGDATRCAIAVRVNSGESVIELEVFNDGLPPQAEARRGQGNQLFDELSVRWTRGEVRGGTRVTAAIPLGSFADAAHRAAAI